MLNIQAQYGDNPVHESYFSIMSYDKLVIKTFPICHTLQNEGSSLFFYILRMFFVETSSIFSVLWGFNLTCILITSRTARHYQHATLSRSYKVSIPIWPAVVAVGVTSTQNFHRLAFWKEININWMNLFKVKKKERSYADILLEKCKKNTYPISFT